jgi:hypothetical protein
MVMQGLRIDSDLDLVGRTQALQGATAEVCGGGLDFVVQGWVEGKGAHAGVSFVEGQTPKNSLRRQLPIAAQL